MGPKKKSAKNALMKARLKELQEESKPNIDLATSIFRGAILEGISSASSELQASKSELKPPEGLEIEDKTTLLGSQKDPLEELESYLAESSPTQIKLSEEIAQAADRTLVVGSAKAKGVEPKVSVGLAKPQSVPSSSSSATYDSHHLQQSHVLSLAQDRIVELEKALETLRRENESLHAAVEIAQSKSSELYDKLQRAERLLQEQRQNSEQELSLFRESLLLKDQENNKLRLKVQELDSRLAQDLKKIRVRERELENRLELSRVEKAALLRAKDEHLLDLQRKNDALKAEHESSQLKVTELQSKIEAHHEQFARTIRALRLALTQLEANDEQTVAPLPIKKAE
jgi:hypothetical protein